MNECTNHRLFDCSLEGGHGTRRVWFGRAMLVVSLQALLKDGEKVLMVAGRDEFAYVDHWFKLKDRADLSRKQAQLLNGCLQVSEIKVNICSTKNTRSFFVWSEHITSGLSPDRLEHSSWDPGLQNLSEEGVSKILHFNKLLR